MRDGAEPPLPLLASIQYLARGVPRISGVTHVLERINGLLDRRVFLDLPRACALGNVPLLRYLARREELYPTEWTKGDPLFRVSQFSRGSVVAAQRGHLSVIEWLVTEYDTETPVTRTVEEAAKFGHLHVLKWLYSHCRCRTFWNGLELINAVVNNHLETAQWLYEHTPLKWLRRPRSAGAHRNMDMTQWLNVIEVSIAAADAIANAAERSRLDALQFVAQQWDVDRIKWMLDNHAACFVNDCGGATDSGHVHVLRWVRAAMSVASRPQKAIWMATAMDRAAKNGHLSIVKWLHQVRSAGCSTAAMDGAGANGHLHVVKWLHANRREGCSTMAMNSSVERMVGCRQMAA